VIPVPCALRRSIGACSHIDVKRQIGNRLRALLAGKFRHLGDYSSLHAAANLPNSIIAPPHERGSNLHSQTARGGGSTDFVLKGKYGTVVADATDSLGGTKVIMA